MKLHQLPIFIFLILAPVAIDAALPPEIYWKSMLPNTTMPKAVKDLLSAGNMGKVIYNGPNNQLHHNPNNLLSSLQRAFIDQLQDDPNNLPLAWRQAASTNQLQDDPNNLIIWRPSVHQLHNDVAPNNQLQDYPNNEIWGWSSSNQLHNDPVNLLLSWSRAPTYQEHDHPNNPVFVGLRAAADQVPDDSSKFLFFLEGDLHPGKKLDMLFAKSSYSKTLISREVADATPFSLKQLPAILKMFSVEPGSNEAKIIEGAIHHCEEPPQTRGEEKQCVTSLESMVDYITSKLGKNVKAYSTEVEKETKLHTYTIAPGVKKISDEAMACHQRHYPYVIFHCHKLGGSNRVYFVPLEGSDGTRVKAIAVCHSDTSDWDANHLAFQMLKIKPGTAPVCHFSPADNVVWTPHKAA